MASRKLAQTTIRAVKGSRPLVPTRAALTLTPSAVNRVKELLSAEPTAAGLRVGLRTRGCNGLSYVLEYAQEKGAKDEEVKQVGATVFIDAKAQLHLLGTEMDFVESELGSEFVFHNPNVKGMCGCGESFNVN